jgi:predicted DCC family thiol-disulfide oxidoreductase YuxK
MPETQPRRATIFYDGGCPKCRREIHHYRKRRGAADMDWIDIHAHPEAMAGTGIRWEAAMRHFHVLDENGQWHTGIDGFRALWRRLPGYRWLAELTDLPGLRPLIGALYLRWADRHFRQRMSDILGDE